jgi:hypothetical protein
MAPAPLVTIASCAGFWDQIIDALAASHDTAVQMIDTSVVRVHAARSLRRGQQSSRYGSLTRGPDEQDPRRGDPNGPPGHLALTPGEAHDNRLWSVLLISLLPQTMLLAEHGRIFRRNEIAKTRSASARICIMREISSNGYKTMSACRDPIRQTLSQLSGFTKLASIRVESRI